MLTSFSGIWQERLLPDNPFSGYFQADLELSEDGIKFRESYSWYPSTQELHWSRVMFGEKNELLSSTNIPGPQGVVWALTRLNCFTLQLSGERLGDFLNEITMEFREILIFATLLEAGKEMVSSIRATEYLPPEPGE